MFAQWNPLPRPVALAGLALALLASAATPFLGHLDVAAKAGKAHHGVTTEKKGHRARTVTRSFAENRGIAIPEGQMPGGVPADPYPSTIEVRGFQKGQILDLDLTLHRFQHGIPLDVGILLVKEGPHPVAVQVLGDVGDVSFDDVAFITLDDEASQELPYFEALTAGRFKPTDHDPEGIVVDPFPASAPAHAPGNDSRLSAFDGINPNGTWRLYVADFRNNDGGSIDGWELTMQVKEAGKKKR